MAVDPIELFKQACEARQRGDHDKADALNILAEQAGGHEHQLCPSAIEDVTSRASQDTEAVEWLLRRAAA